MPRQRWRFANGTWKSPSPIHTHNASKTAERLREALQKQIDSHMWYERRDLSVMVGREYAGHDFYTWPNNRRQYMFFKYESYSDLQGWIIQVTALRQLN